MFEMADYKLGDLLGIAGATIGIIIAGGVLLGAISGRYAALFDRFRALTGELRGDKRSDSRRGSLQTQLNSYRSRLSYLNYGSAAVTAALLLFLATVATASLAVMFPKALVFRAWAPSACSAASP